MDTNHLQCFVTAADAGSMTRAAQRLDISQPALSARIRRLEEQIGAPLFERLPRGITPTDTGWLMLPLARRALAGLRDVESALVGAAHRRFAFGAIPTVAPMAGPAAVGRLREAGAEQIQVIEDFTTELICRVLAGELDAAIVSTPLDAQGLNVEEIGVEPFVVAVSQNHPLADSLSLGVPDLRGAPAVALNDMHCLDRQLNAFCTLRHLTMPVVCTTAQVGTLLEMVAANVGVAIVPRMFQRLGDSGRVRFVPMKRGSGSRTLALLRRSTCRAPELDAALRAAVRDALEEQPTLGRRVS
ncbi:MAG: LysR family transcriptional regulator [Acidobacteriota bacterium]